VTNDGPDTATNVTLLDLLPTQVQIESATATEGTYDPTTGIWSVGTVANATTQTLTITALVIHPDPVANTASISHSDQFDPDTSNNSDTASVTPQQADLEMTKIVNNPRPNFGQVVTYVIRLTNNGPSAATRVRVRDLLPAGMTFVSATPSQGNYNSTTGVWTVGTVPNGASRGLRIQARVNSPNTQTNRATISHSDQFDPDPGNNSASATLTPQRADLAVTKTVDNPTPNLGSTVTFIISVNNHGPDTATNVRVKDLLPAGLTLVSANPSQGTYNPTTGIWAVGTVDPSVAQTLTITARVDSPNAQTNISKIRHSDQFDPHPGNNTASVTLMPRNVADLSVTKVASAQQATISQLVTFTVTVHNNGPNVANNVVVTDPLPPGVTFVSAHVPLGTYQPTTGQWSIPVLAPKVVAILRVTVRINASGTILNTARVDFPGFDPDLSNNAATAEINGVAALSKRMLIGSSFM
jgi:uncharacterized repeat protein (TIGR01451 family)